MGVEPPTPSGYASDPNVTNPNPNPTPGRARF